MSSTTNLLPGLSGKFKSTILISLILVILLSLLDLVGWGFNISVFRSISPHWEPMKINSALCFIFATAALLVMHSKLTSFLRKGLAAIFAISISCISLITMYHYFVASGYIPAISINAFPSVKNFYSSEMIMPFLSAFNFLLFAVMLFLYLPEKGKPSGLAAILMIPFFMVSYYIIVSYILGVGTVFTFGEAQVALNAGISFSALGIATTLARPHTLLLKLFNPTNSGGVISRKLLPALVILPIFVGWLSVMGERTSVFESEKGVVIVAVVYVICFLILTFLTARSINKVDTKRHLYEEALRESREQLSAVFNGVNDLLLLIDLEGNIIAANNAASLQLNNGMPGLEGKCIYDLVPAKLHAKRKKQISELVLKKKPVRFQNKSGDLIYDVIFYPVFDNKNNVIQYISHSIDITDKKKTENLIRESEQRLKYHLENSPLAVIEWDNNFNVVQWSDEAEKIFGLKKEEVIGTRIDSLDIIYEEDMPIVAKTMERLTSGKELKVVSHNRNYNKSKEIIYCVWYNSVLFDEKGRMSSVMSLVENITQLKKAEISLMESEIRFRTIAESVPVLIMIRRISEPVVSYVNEAYEKAFGFEKGELTGNTINDIFYYSEDRKSIGEALQENGVINNLEVKVKKRDGTPFWILTSITRIMFMNEPSYLTSSIDITGTKEAQEELIRLNNALDAHNKSSQVMMHSHNEMQYLNEVCRLIIEDCGHTMVWIGYVQDDEVRSVKPMAFYGFDQGYIDRMNITCDDSERGRGPTGTAIRTGKPTVCKNMRTDPNFAPWREDAIARGYESSLVLPLIFEGKPLGAMSIYSKEPDAFLENEIELLSDLADDLAYGISYIKLEESEREAARVLKENEAKLKELVATKDKFFNIVAHDLKNPFTSLLGSSELLYENIDNLNKENIRKLTMILNDSAKSGYDILQNLHDWSRSQTGGLVINPERINLKNMIDRNILNLQLAATNKKIKLLTNVEDDIYIFADINMTNTVLRNLLSNAVKFTHRGGKVAVSVKAGPRGTIVSVKDNGTGIPKERIDKLFRIETRNSTPGTENEQGTGLGLKLCKEFVEKQGGRIWVESEENKGSEFLFSIPVMSVTKSVRTGKRIEFNDE
jgi:PAS domain S-box-containing protein